jgi:hypothetical protein
MSSDYVTGRKALKIRRKENCNLLETGTVELNGVILKKVNTAVINHKKTTYFKCRNMRTPTHVTGVCIFSGRIVDFPIELEMEILHEHSNTCCYSKGKKDPPLTLTSAPEKKKVKKKKNNSMINQVSIAPRRRREEKMIQTPYMLENQEGMDLPDIYIQLWTDEDIKRVMTMSAKLKAMEQMMIK